MSPMLSLQLRPTVQSPVISCISRCGAVSERTNLKIDKFDSSRRIVGLNEVIAGEIDVLGWNVIHLANGEIIGQVHELMPVGSTDEAYKDEIFQHLLCVLDPVNVEIRYLVPMVDAIVKSIDRNYRCLGILPPDGLLELGRRQQKLEKLQLDLFDYKKSKKCQGKEVDKERMPSRMELIENGRRDLVKKIMEVGGFLSVAQALNLRACRKPDGFWENVDHIDSAIESFIENSWNQITSEGESHYYNKITKEFSLERPSPERSIVKCVMPRQKSLIAARQWDLHHAIRIHGGYRTVAKQLGRDFVPIYTFSELVKDFQTFIKEHQMTHFPGENEIKAHGRADLAYLARRHGGLRGVAKEAGLLFKPRKPIRKHKRTFPVAIQEFKGYLYTKLPSEEVHESNLLWENALQAGVKLPTITQLEKDRRTDLKYMLRKFGHLSIARELRINLSSTRGSKALKQNIPI